MSLNFGQGLFPQRGEILANYNYTDIAEGIGYQVYYGLKANTDEYIISPSPYVKSEVIAYGATMSSTSYTKEIDLTFDITFNKPKTVQGNIIACVPVGVFCYSTLNNPYYVNGYAKIRCYHYNGSAETQIGSEETGNVVTADVNNGDSGQAIMTVAKFATSGKKHFKAGETLRFDIEGWYLYDGTFSTKTGYIGMSPSNESWGYIDDGFTSPDIGDPKSYCTQLTFHVPFVLDI